MNIYNLLEKIIYNLFFFSLAVDYLNGFFYFKGINFPISSSIKLFLLSAIIIINLKNKKILLNFIIIFLLFVQFLLHLKVENIIYFSRFLIFINVFYYLQTKKIKYKKIKDLFKFNYYFLLFVIILGKIGFGMPMYHSTNTGTKGYFIAGNEISAVFILLYFFNLVEVKKNNNVPFVISGALLAILTQTKVALLGYIIITFYYYILVKKNKWVKLLAIFSSVAVILKSITIFQSLSIYTKFSHMQSQGGLLNALFSGRWSYLEIVYFEITKMINIIYILFGFPTSRITEMDFFDSLLKFGVLLSLTIFYFLIKIIKIEDKNLKFINGLLIIISMFFGHIIYSAMLGIYWGILNAHYYKKRRE